MTLREIDRPGPVENGSPERPPAPDLDALLARQRELRSRLIDARDALVRARLAAPEAPDAPRPSSPETAAVPPASAPSRAGEPAGYAALRARLRSRLAGLVPPGGLALIVSRGDARLLELPGGGRGWHFPGDGGGGYAGHHPPDSSAAIAEVEARRRQGAAFLVFPATSRWWLDHYRELARHLDERYRKVVDDPESCVVYALAQPARAPEAPVRAAGRRPLAVTTIISRNYLAQARVLAQSFFQHEPDGRFYLLVVDRLPEGVAADPGVTLVDPRELEIPNFFEMCFKYGVVELATAVKPYLLSTLAGRYGEEELVYLDPDILILRPLDELRAALESGGIVLTPHILRPLPTDGKRPNEQDIIISGAFNLGFIALRRSPETTEFLEWWQDRLQDGCRIDVANGLFTDQKWIDLVPGLFPSTTILRDPTYNVAFWNLHERTITRQDETFLVNGRPAAFCHISGFDPRKPHKLSRHQTRVEVAPGSDLAALLDRYVALLEANGFEESSRWEYGYSRFDNGIRVHALLRQIYLNLSREERLRFGDPFASGATDSFLEWATRPREEDGGLSLFLRTLYQVRYDLPLTFPEVRGRDRERFLEWARRWGAVEMHFEPELVKDPPAAARTTAATPAEKPAAPAGPEPRRRPASSYEELIERVRNVAQAILPAGSRVLVVSKGDYRLLELGGCEGWHFPQTDNGVYGGYHPPNGRVAVAHLEALRAKGADYFLIPQTALWWLEYYEELRRHLETRYRLVVRDHDACLIYSLRDDRPRAAASPSRWRRWLPGSWATAPPRREGGGAAPAAGGRP